MTNRFKLDPFSELAPGGLESFLQKLVVWFQLHLGCGIQKDAIGITNESCASAHRLILPISQIKGTLRWESVRAIKWCLLPNHPCLAFQLFPCGEHCPPLPVPKWNREAHFIEITRWFNQTAGKKILVLWLRSPHLHLSGNWKSLLKNNYFYSAREKYSLFWFLEASCYTENKCMPQTNKQTNSFINIYHYC